MKTTLVLLLSALLLVVVNAQPKAGVKVAISQTAMDYIKNVMLPLAQAQIANTALPDISTTADTPIGKIDIQLTGIVMNTLTVDASQITLIAPNTLQVSITAEIGCHLNWHYKKHGFPPVSDGGDADVSLRSLSIVIAISYGVDGNGRPTAVVSQCSISIGDVDINLHGGASWLYQLFINLFSSQIKSSVQSALSNQIPGIVNTQLAKAFSSMPIEEQVQPGVVINYALQAAPIVVSPGPCLGISARGEFYAVNNRQETPDSPAAMPDAYNGQMLQIEMSEWTFNSAGFAFMMDGKLSGNLTIQEYPSQPSIFNSSTLAQAIPNIQQYYPNALLYYSINTADAPSITLAAADPQLSVTIATDLTVYAMNPSTGVFDEAFSLGMKVMLQGDASVDANAMAITAVLEVIEIDLTQLGSNVGPIDVDNLSAMANFVADSALDKINGVLAQGFALPKIDGIRLVNPALVFQDGYFVVVSDFTYTPN